MKDRFSAVEQQLGQKIWRIVTLFYRSHVAFKELFERYEKKVGGYSQVLGLPRDNLRLNSRELASLLDLKSMERIRDGYIHDLKDLCHLVFRGQDQTDLGTNHFERPHGSVESSRAPPGSRRGAGS